MNQKNNRYWLARNFHSGNCNLFRNEPVKNGKTWTDPTGNENDFPKEGISSKEVLTETRQIHGETKGGLYLRHGSL